MSQINSRVYGRRASGGTSPATYVQELTFSEAELQQEILK